jgi:AcrR family transcriptional regulator
MTTVATAPSQSCLRKGRPRDQRIDRGIAAAALNVLADVGFARFSVEEVAQRAGVAKTTVYRRFPTRSDLIAGALEQLSEEGAGLRVEGSVRDRLVAILTAIRRSTPNSTRGRVLMHAVGSDDPELARLVHDRVLSSRSALIRSVIEDGMATGELRSDVDSDAVMAVLVGPMLYLGMWRMRDGVRRVQVDDIVDLVMTGLTRATDS